MAREFELEEKELELEVLEFALQEMGLSFFSLTLFLFPELQHSIYRWRTSIELFFAFVQFCTGEILKAPVSPVKKRNGITNRSVSRL